MVIFLFRVAVLGDFDLVAAVLVAALPAEGVAEVDFWAADLLVLLDVVLLAVVLLALLAVALLADQRLRVRLFAALSLALLSAESLVSPGLSTSSLRRSARRFLVMSLPSRFEFRQQL